LSGKSSRSGWWLAGLFLAALLMGAGPGVLLVNQPATWFGFPRLYVWALFWCAVEIAIVVVAYWTVWRAAERSHE
jgi:hypothetical protein